MVQYFSFDILKPNRSSSFRKYFLSVVSYTAKDSLRVKGNLLAPWFNVHTLYMLHIRNHCEHTR